MSRSYKKYPYWKIERSCKKSKKIANNKVRAYLKTDKEIPNGNAYKKIFESWEICDYCSSITLKEWLKRWKDNKYKWYTCYKMK